LKKREERERKKVGGREGTREKERGERERESNFYDASHLLYVTFTFLGLSVFLGQL